jgi:anti-sigma-K factor RskA
MVHMMGMKNSDVATIVWNPKNKEVYLAVNQLIEPPSGKQYQLWAIVDNQPVDLGVFDPDMKSYEMIRMKDVENASAFAVTLEKEGGSPVPTMEAMWLMGGV